MEARTAAYLRLHTAVLLFGLTGIFGVLITLNPIALVWWRITITVMSFLLWPGLLRKALALPRRSLRALMGIGILVALHWVTFFGSIALTNASVAVAVLASIALWTSILEPIITKTKFKWYEVGLGLAVVPGVLLIKNSTEFPLVGIIVAGLSALLSALFSVLNKIWVARHAPATMTFVELGSGWIFLTLCLPLLFVMEPDVQFMPQGWDFLYLPVLALACTTLAYVLSLKALEHISSFSSNLTINLEPVYTILLAWPLLGEDKELNAGFYAGAAIIIGSVFAHPILHKYLEGK